eukprot:CAMPEP_0194422178 /NCGR_PEP_ID=MMETSP0176-20130528/21434_1 /TAXON_ID=216777 /ORGANISM="Proboscia alata, Strain PI-D3" /LENGTH=597 /DNA_ID=CAMNT_0039230703 /DNA_START=6 /DNA_END=1802 /DNA_ORIENTATION=-
MPCRSDDEFVNGHGGGSARSFSLDDMGTNVDDDDNNERVMYISTIDPNNNDGEVFGEEDSNISHGYTPLDTGGGDDDDDGMQYDQRVMTMTSATFGEEGNDDNGYEDNNNDFDMSIADTALRSLEQDYASTLERVSQQPQEHEILSSVTEEGECEAEEHDDDKEELFVEAATTQELQGECHPAVNIEKKAQVSSLVLPPRNNIDTEAVKRAVESIRLKAPKFTAVFDAVETTRKMQQKTHQHSIIPNAPLNSFFKPSKKAIQASHNLSRSATLAEVFLRLFVNVETTFSSSLPETGSMYLADNDNSGKTLVIHIIGADYVECQNEETISKLLGPFVRWMCSFLAKKRNDASSAGLLNCITEIQLELIGPNVPIYQNDVPLKVDLLPTLASSTNSDTPSCGQICKATAICCNALYHDYFRTLLSNEQGTDSKLPTFLIAFNAGIWGYDDWNPTLELLCVSNNDNRQQKRRKHTYLPLVVTAYTLEEAEDDFDVMQETVNKAKLHDAKEVGMLNNDNNISKNETHHNNQNDAKDNKKEKVTSMKDDKMILQKSNETTCRVLWKPEINPYRSRLQRITKSDFTKGRKYYENGAWQAWLCT